MSIMSGLRDTVAALSFDRRLQEVRDQQLQRVLDGRPMTDDELREAEREAALQVARLMYSDDTALAMGIATQRGERDHRKDYAARSSTQADVAALVTHQVICALPVVGDPEHAVR